MEARYLTEEEKQEIRKQLEQELEEIKVIIGDWVEIELNIRINK